MRPSWRRAEVGHSGENFEGYNPDPGSSLGFLVCEQPQTHVPTAVNGAAPPPCLPHPSLEAWAKINLSSLQLFLLWVLVRDVNVIRYPLRLKE